MGAVKKIGIVGLGLIGGSFGLVFKNRGYQVLGVDANEEHLKKSLELNIIDRSAELKDLYDCEFIFVAIPVDAIAKVIKDLLSNVHKNTLIIDAGSVKNKICETIKEHPNRGNYLAAHPLAGTENSGPDAALKCLFSEKVMILCETEKTNWELLDNAIAIFKDMNMRLRMMSPEEHDKHIAYVSHLSHISSFMLGKTVLEIEKNNQNIFDMASTGFASTVRLAKSSPYMWQPIFTENKEPVLKSLDSYIENLKIFRDQIAQNKKEEIIKEIKHINSIKKVLEKK